MRMIQNLGEFDIVYLVKPARSNEELKYSLRTVEKNFPCRSVWFYGGCPDDLEPDYYVYVNQAELGDRKWYRTTAMLEMVCREEELSEWIWLFNDDFFIVEHAPEIFTAIYHGSIQHRIEEIEEKHGGRSEYSNLLRRTKEILKAERIGTNNYATHTPLLINRREALQTIQRFSTCPMFRCLYGNMWDIGGQDAPDVKVNNIEEEWDERSWCMSTSDKTFEKGKAGKYIRDRFQDPSRWELQNDHR